MLPVDLVAKLNECAKTDFVNMRDWWFSAAFWATALVALGLIFEAPELLHELAHIRRKRIARLKNLPAEFPDHKAPDWVKVVAFVGWILIVGGVVGEGFAGIKVNNLDANIQECSDAKVQAATLEVGDAATSAKDAHDLGISLLGKYKAAEQELIELEAEKLPRRLSSGQEATFRRAVTSFKGSTLDLSCSTPGGNAKEPLDFEMDFVDAVSHKTPVNLTYLISCNVSIGPGVFVQPIQVEVGAERTSDGEILIKALAAIGINKKQITKKPSANRGYLGLTIGPKAP